jgi:glucokinase
VPRHGPHTLYNLAVTLDLQRVSIGGSVFWHHQRLLLPRLQAGQCGRLAALTDGLSWCHNRQVSE